MQHKYFKESMCIMLIITIITIIILSKIHHKSKILLWLSYKVAPFLINAPTVSSCSLVRGFGG